MGPKQYTNDDLKKAIGLVRKGTSIRKASEATGVPKMTVYDHAKGRFCNKDTRHGGLYTLSLEEESSLVNYSKYMSEHGFPLTRKILKRLTVDIVKSRVTPTYTKVNHTSGPSDKWIRSFLKRNPQISLRAPHPLEKDRACVTADQIDNYFDLLEKTLNKLGIKDNPNQIFNLDETGFSGKERSKEKIVVPKGTKHCYQPVAGVSGHVTFNMAISAAGKVVAPLVIFSKCFPREDYKAGMPEEWSFKQTKSGYINNEIFIEWFRDQFIPQCGRGRPILVIMDNHTSHISKDVIDLANENNITLLCLPSHSTHLLQPLDVGVYHIFKQKVSEIGTSLGYCGLKTIPRHTFPKVIQLALAKISSSVISSSFLACGIWPLQPTKVVRPETSKNVVVECDDAVPSTSGIENVTAVEKRDNIHNSTTDSEINKLVQLGIITEELRHVLIEPPKIVKKTSKRKTLDNARVITDEHEESNINADAKRKKISEKNNSTKKPVIKKKQEQTKGSKKGVRKKSKQRTNKLIVELDESQTLCEVCMTGTNLLTWYGCDKCERWYHYECLPSGEQTFIDLSTVTDIPWLCNQCNKDEE